MIPALLTRIWTAPKWAMADLAQSRMDSSLATSRAKVWAVPPASIDLGGDGGEFVETAGGEGDGRSAAGQLKGAGAADSL